MVDLIYGRGITDLIREMPFYISIFKKYASIKLFHAKPTMYGSVDIINVCNLHCTHCYWWLNRKNDSNDLNAEQWREIINNTFKKQNILDYIAGPNRHNKPAWKDIWITMTINSLNYDSVEDLTHEWNGRINKIGFQFHTPFVMGDPLWLPFGDIRNNVVERLISLKKKYPNFVVNGIKQLSLMKGNWGGIGTTPVQCPSWAILSLDHMGRVKQPCCIGSADSNSLKPICEQCGLGCYSVLVAQGIKGGN